MRASYGGAAFLNNIDLKHRFVGSTGFGFSGPIYMLTSVRSASVLSAHRCRLDIYDFHLKSIIIRQKRDGLQAKTLRLLPVTAQG